MHWKRKWMEFEGGINGSVTVPFALIKESAGTSLMKWVNLHLATAWALSILIHIYLQVSKSKYSLIFFKQKIYMYHTLRMLLVVNKSLDWRWNFVAFFFFFSSVWYLWMSLNGRHAMKNEFSIFHHNCMNIFHRWAEGTMWEKSGLNSIVTNSPSSITKNLIILVGWSLISLLCCNSVMRLEAFGGLRLRLCSPTTLSPRRPFSNFSSVICVSPFCPYFILSFFHCFCSLSKRAIKYQMDFF